MEKLKYSTDDYSLSIGDLVKIYNPHSSRLKMIGIILEKHGNSIFEVLIDGIIQDVGSNYLLRVEIN